MIAHILMLLVLASHRKIHTRATQGQKQGKEQTGTASLSLGLKVAPPTVPMCITQPSLWRVPFNGLLQVRSSLLEWPGRFGLA